MTNNPTITWNRPKLERFQRAYQRAVKAQTGTFTFDGYEFVLDYAKYLIQYLEAVL